MHVLRASNESKHRMFIKENQIKCMNFAKKFKIEPIALRENLIFTDESKFEIFDVKNPQKYGEV